MVLRSTFSLTNGASEHTLQFSIQKHHVIDGIAIQLLEEVMNEELAKLRNFEFEMSLACLQQSSSCNPYSGGQKKRSWSGMICNLERLMLSYLHASLDELPCVRKSLNDCVASVLEKSRRLHCTFALDVQKTLLCVMQRVFALLKMKLVLRSVIEELTKGNGCKNDLLKVAWEWELSNHSDIEDEREKMKRLRSGSLNDVNGDAL